MTTEDATALYRLRRLWQDAYIITLSDGMWAAGRHDRPTQVLTADTAAREPSGGQEGREPSGAVERVMAALVPGLRPVASAAIPSSAELQLGGRFFRGGITGAYRDELAEVLHLILWSRARNAAAMDLLGWRGA